MVVTLRRDCDLANNTSARSLLQVGVWVTQYNRKSLSEFIFAPLMARWLCD